MKFDELTSELSTDREGIESADRHRVFSDDGDFTEKDGPSSSCGDDGG